MIRPADENGFAAEAWARNAQAYEAIRTAVTSERTIEAACKQTWCAIPTSVGKLVFQGAYVTAVWPRRTLVSAGPRATPLPRVENIR